MPSHAPPVCDRVPAGLLPAGVVIAWAAAFLLSLGFRPLFPVDETRYVSVAWEMWVRGDFLVPHLNGELYGHKPPLLFWLMHAGWWLFGVNEWWPRLVPALFALGSLAMCAVLARRLWQDQPAAGALGALMLATSVLYFVFTGLIMFDMLVAFFALLGVTGVLWAAQGGAWRAWMLVGAAIGLGILAKGPVILLHVLPVALLAPLWRRPDPDRAWGRWYVSLLAALALGSGIALAWALAAAQAGGEAYANEILWSQTAHRVVESFAHRRAWWWYLPVVPLVFLPWSLWPPLLRALPRVRGLARDAGARFVLAWVVPSFLALSLVSGKNVNYLLPVLPGLALLGAHLALAAGSRSSGWDARVPGLFPLAAGIALVWLRQQAATADSLRPLADIPLWPGFVLLAAGLALLFRPLGSGRRALASAMLGLYAVLYAGILGHAAPAYDMAPVARQLSQLEQGGVPVAHVGKYYGEFHFLGRLRRPLPRLERHQVEPWLEAHPDGRVVALASMWQPADGRRPEYSHTYRSNTISIWAKGSG